jgi:Glycosyl hydrolase family 47
MQTRMQHPPRCRTTSPTWLPFGWSDGDAFSLQGYPLRPELAESTYLLHAATGDAAYLAAGRELQVVTCRRR